MKERLRRMTPQWVLHLYHRALSVFSALIHRYPGNKLFVIGVTGTNGKSTVVEMIGHILRSSGKRVAWISTATESIGEGVTLNSRKMTMPGHGFLHTFMRKALQAGCTHVVLEVSSEGLAQYRHISIPFDVGVFTNISPEHIESHGSFGAYRDAKLGLFRNMSARRYTKFGKPQERTGVINIDDKEGPNFMTAHLERFFITTRHGNNFLGTDKMFSAENVQTTEDGHQIFSVDGFRCNLPMLGDFNIDNALSAIAASHAAGISIEESTRALEYFPGVPGRLEFITTEPFTVIVDYAPEPASMDALYSVASTLSHKRIIHIFGSAGGGRDKARRPVLGKIVGNNADIAIVTNEDPYDEKPEVIINQVAQGVVSVGRLHRGEELFLIPERRQAIRKAIALAQPGDLVLITGKACEQWIMGPLGTRIPWDDRRVAREELNNKGYLSTDSVDS